MGRKDDWVDVSLEEALVAVPEVVPEVVAELKKMLACDLRRENMARGSLKTCAQGLVKKSKSKASAGHGERDDSAED